MLLNPLDVSGRRDGHGVGAVESNGHVGPVLPSRIEEADKDTSYPVR